MDLDHPDEDVENEDDGEDDDDVVMVMKDGI